MTSLPQWIEDAKCANYFKENCGKCQFARALEIALEGLSNIIQHQAIVSKSLAEFSATRTIAQSTIKRIEELPNEKRERIYGD